MAVRTQAQLEAAYAALYADSQADDSITPARIRAFWVDFFDSVLDNPAILQGALDANIVTSMIRNGNITAEKLADDAEPAGWALNSGASGRAPKARMPSDTVYDADLDTLFSAAVSSGGSTSFTLTRVDGATTTINLAEGIRDLMGTTLVQGSGITIAVDDDANTITISATGSGGSTPPPASHTRYFGRSADTTFTATEFTGANGQSETDDTFAALPTWSGNDYLAFAVPDSTGDITGIVLGSSDINQIGAFQRVSGILQINSVAYKVWRSNNELNFSGERAILTQAA